MGLHTLIIYHGYGAGAIPNENLPSRAPPEAILHVLISHDDKSVENIHEYAVAGGISKGSYHLLARYPSGLIPISS